MSLSGARPFHDRNEIKKLVGAMRGEFQLRNRALTISGCRTGLRVSELLSWRVGDVLDGRSIRTTVYTRRDSIKGKRAGRRLALHPEARFAIGRWLVDLEKRGVALDPERPLFCSRENEFLNPMSRKSAHHAVAKAAALAGLDEGISTHSWRKWLATQVYKRSGNCLIQTGQILGHRQISTTWRYCRSLSVGSERLLLDL